MIDVPARPDWLEHLRIVCTQVQPSQLTRFVPPEGATPRPAAILLLFGEGPQGPQVLLLERAADLRAHAGQVAFPGGAEDPGDGGAVGTALREAREETGLDPAGVQVLGVLPTLWLPVTDFAVTPVLGWWRAPSPVYVVDPAETASVHTVALAELLDPVNRMMVHHPSGHTGPAFHVDGLLVWGFTAGILSRLFALAGWERPWDVSRVEELPPEALSRSLRDLPDSRPSGERA